MTKRKHRHKPKPGRKLERKVAALERRQHRQMQQFKREVLNAVHHLLSPQVDGEA
jgi:hypothetical protein